MRKGCSPFRIYEGRSVDCWYIELPRLGEQMHAFKLDVGPGKYIEFGRRINCLGQDYSGGPAAVG